MNATRASYSCRVSQFHVLNSAKLTISGNRKELHSPGKKFKKKCLLHYTADIVRLTIAEQISSQKLLHPSPSVMCIHVRPCSARCTSLKRPNVWTNIKVNSLKFPPLDSNLAADFEFIFIRFILLAVDLLKVGLHLYDLSPILENSIWLKRIDVAALKIQDIKMDDNKRKGIEGKMLDRRQCIIPNDWHMHMWYVDSAHGPRNRPTRVNFFLLPAWFENKKVKKHCITLLEQKELWPKSDGKLDDDQMDHGY